MITDLARYFENGNRSQDPGQSSVCGIRFNVTRAGIHVDGLLKNEEIYNIFDTTRILKRPIILEITDKSGKAGIAHWINSHLDLKGEDAVDKRHPGVSMINQWVMKSYEEGRLTSISHEEMDKQVRKYLPELFMSDLEKIKHRAIQVAVAVAEEVIGQPLMMTMDPAHQEPIMQRIIDENPSIQFAYVVRLERKEDDKKYNQHCRPGKVREFRNRNRLLGQGMVPGALKNRENPCD